MFGLESAHTTGNCGTRGFAGTFNALHRLETGRHTFECRSEAVTTIPVGR